MNTAHKEEGWDLVLKLVHYLKKTDTLQSAVLVYLESVLKELRAS